MKIINEYRPDHRLPKMAKWSFMAFVLVETLTEALENKKLEADSIPAGVLMEGKEFYRTMDHILDSPKYYWDLPFDQKSENYEIVRHFIGLRHPELSEKNIREHLKKISKFVQNISTPQTLTSADDIETVKNLLELLQPISGIGAAERYSETAEENH